MNLAIIAWCLTKLTSHLTLKVKFNCTFMFYCFNENQLCSIWITLAKYLLKIPNTS